MNNFYREAGNRIRLLRETLNISREAFAEYAEISPKFLYEIENGRKGFSADKLFKISKALKVSSEYILSGYSNDDDLELNEILKMFTPDQKREITIMLKSVYKISVT